MKQALVAVLLTSQDDMDLRKVDIGDGTSEMSVTDAYCCEYRIRLSCLALTL